MVSWLTDRIRQHHFLFTHYSFLLSTSVLWLVWYPSVLSEFNLPKTGLGHERSKSYFTRTIFKHISRVNILGTSYEIALILGESHRFPLMISKHGFGWCLWQQAITRSKVAQIGVAIIIGELSWPKTSLLTTRHITCDTYVRLIVKLYIHISMHMLRTLLDWCNNLTFLHIPARIISHGSSRWNIPETSR